MIFVIFSGIFRPKPLNSSKINLCILKSVKNPSKWVVQLCITLKNGWVISAQKFDFLRFSKRSNFRGHFWPWRWPDIKNLRSPIRLLNRLNFQKIGRNSWFDHGKAFKMGDFDGRFYVVFWPFCDHFDHFATTHEVTCPHFWPRWVGHLVHQPFLGPYYTSTSGGRPKTPKKVPILTYFLNFLHFLQY